MRFCESCIKTVQAVSAKPIGLGYRYFNLQRTAKVNSPYKGVQFQLKMVSYRWEKPKRAPPRLQAVSARLPWKRCQRTVVCKHTSQWMLFLWCLTSQQLAELYLRVCLLVGCLLNVPATCGCISGTDLLRQLYVLPH